MWIYVMPTLTRILITFCVGVAAILAWQSYGDAARQIIASAYPQAGWLAPRTVPIGYSAPSTTGLVAQTSGITHSKFSLRSRCTAMLAGLRTMIQAGHGPIIGRETGGFVGGLLGFGSSSAVVRVIRSSREVGL
jgi:hypothetical protein